ncbi:MULTISPECIES: hypothetical protein [unclassified Pseudomonas]|uniref:hypothetical protein n=1 Tax=unclassified Pseudomonas TaxID=196821 RepID=UPI002A36C9B0|nr:MULTISPECIES: hypothetical protein [unclassified Pseudomonas]MDX9670333.1 hypothetical protein [Pseudomonas sp. P8_250]WPN35659.1 hypothetical protein QMK53_26280 [Pseudomonas sp. P8_139]WPN42538.1 hypothetical protein QMK55_05095 [Pseudomonas sp. P8_229]
MSLLFLCSACTQNPPVPPIDIQFESVSYVPGYERFNVRFSSDKDLLKFFDVNAGRNQTYEGLACYLGAKVELSERQGESDYLDGMMVEVDRKDSQTRYQYSAELIAVHTDHEYGSNTFISSKELLGLLNSHNALACRFYASAYGYGRYYSRPMGVPASDFVRVLTKEEER